MIAGAAYATAASAFQKHGAQFFMIVARLRKLRAAVFGSVDGGAGAELNRLTPASSGAGTAALTSAHAPSQTAAFDQPSMGPTARLLSGALESLRQSESACGRDGARVVPRARYRERAFDRRLRSVFVHFRRSSAGQPRHMETGRNQNLRSANQRHPPHRN